MCVVCRYLSHLWKNYTCAMCTRHHTHRFFFIFFYESKNQNRKPILMVLIHFYIVFIYSCISLKKKCDGFFGSLWSLLLLLLLLLMLLLFGWCFQNARSHTKLHKSILKQITSTFVAFAATVGGCRSFFLAEISFLGKLRLEYTHTQNNV